LNGMSSRKRARTREFDPMRDYPLASKRPDLVRTPSGKSFKDITPENVASGKTGSQEFRIRPETLDMQARIAEAQGRMQLSVFSTPIIARVKV
jgi:propanediol dehydratase small subunit